MNATMLFIDISQSQSPARSQLISSNVNGLNGSFQEMPPDVACAYVYDTKTGLGRFVLNTIYFQPSNYNLVAVAVVFKPMLDFHALVVADADRWLLPGNTKIVRVYEWSEILTRPTRVTNLITAPVAVSV